MASALALELVIGATVSSTVGAAFKAIEYRIARLKTLGSKAKVLQHTIGEAVRLREELNKTHETAEDSGQYLQRQLEINLDLLRGLRREVRDLRGELPRLGSLVTFRVAVEAAKAPGVIVLWPPALPKNKEAEPVEAVTRSFSWVTQQTRNVVLGLTALSASVWGLAAFSPRVGAPRDESTPRLPSLSIQVQTQGYEWAGGQASLQVGPALPEAANNAVYTSFSAPSVNQQAQGKGGQAAGFASAEIVGTVGAGMVVVQVAQTCLGHEPLKASASAAAEGAEAAQADNSRFGLSSVVVALTALALGVAGGRNVARGGVLSRGWNTVKEVFRPTPAPRPRGATRIEALPPPAAPSKMQEGWKAMKPAVKAELAPALLLAALNAGYTAMYAKTADEKADGYGNAAGSAIGSVVGAGLGERFIRIPKVGQMIGTTLGGFVGGKFGGWLGKKLFGSDGVFSSADEEQAGKAPAPALSPPNTAPGSVVRQMANPQPSGDSMLPLAPTTAPANPAPQLLTQQITIHQQMPITVQGDLSNGEQIRQSLLDEMRRQMEALTRTTVAPLYDPSHV